MTRLTSFTCTLLFVTLALACLIQAERPVGEKLAAGKNLTVRDGFVVLHSFVGDLKVPIPAPKELELTHGRVRRDLYSHGPMYLRDMADFFSCSEQAQYALSPFADNHRNWEAFFKRNHINNTLTVRLIRPQTHFHCKLGTWRRLFEKWRTRFCP
jgi:hypothetical protein